jgi:hypothetical protein
LNDTPPAGSVNDCPAPKPWNELEPVLDGCMSKIQV